VTADDRARSAASNAVLGEAVAGLREELARAEAGRDAAERTAGDETARLRRELDHARDRADRLEGELRAVLDEVRRP
jgi:predicted  nucleic acid-binding Zn-ribbon protein